MPSHDTEGPSRLSTATSPRCGRARTAAETGASLTRRARPVRAIADPHGPSGPDEVRQEEAEIRRALGEATDEVAVPVLAEGHEHPEPGPQAAQRVVKVRSDPVEHLELVALGAESELARPVGDDPDEALVVRREGGVRPGRHRRPGRSEEHTSELQSLRHLVCRLLLE